jgi:nanoRNase/pAp phosphatase (c-di-AMP/oligoRNAs hydrolase)
MGNPLNEAKKFLREIGEKKALITFHSLGDLDAVCSAIALKKSLKNATVASPDKVNSEAKRFLLSINETIPLLSTVNPKDFSFIIVLDTNSPFLLPEAAGLQIDLIIDHHSVHPDSLKSRYALIDNTVSSTCELLFPLLEKVDEKTALCLLVGMISDSANFKNANQNTFPIISKLLQKAGLPYNKILSFTSVPADISQRIALFKACKRLQFQKIGDVLIARSVSSFESHAASAFIELGADFSFVGHEGKEDARISARIRPEFSDAVDLPSIMSEAGKIIGGDGGGHQCAAGATGKYPDKIDEALDFCVETVLARLKEHGL